MKYKVRNIDFKVNVMKGKLTIAEITNLKSHEIFVFGSNMQGEHVGGAAKIAYEKFGADWGLEEGESGQTYAIPTVDFTSDDRMELEDIKVFVQRFIEHVKVNQNKKYIVTAIGCGIAGFEYSEIAPMFSECLFIGNVSLPKEFWDNIKNVN